MALDDAMAGNRDVILLGEDIADPQAGGVLGVTQGLSTKYGQSRVRSTPISEQAIIGAAIGAAMVGMRPVAEIMLMNFTAVAMDMIVNHAAKLRFMSGGQNSDYLEAWFAHTAGIKVVAPSSPADAYGLLLSCIDDDDPCLFIENLPTYWATGPAPERGQRIPLGKAHVMRHGTDVTLISYSRAVNDCADAAAQLAMEGIDVELIDLRTVAPFDQSTIIESVAKTGRAVIVHEALRNFGVGAEIAACISEHLHGQLKHRVLRMGAPQCPVPFSKVLENAFLPDKN